MPGEEVGERVGEAELAEDLALGGVVHLEELDEVGVRPR